MAGEPMTEEEADFKFENIVKSQESCKGTKIEELADLIAGGFRFNDIRPS